MRKALGYICIFIGIGIGVYVLYANSNYAVTNRTFSSYTLLSSSWEKYKMQFIQKDGRVIDHSQHDITTSEGQSYAMLRAVWIDDKPTFDLVWKWTKTTLKRPKDNLFGWRWGKENNKYGFISNGGNNSASDADSDIALALILAANRWQQENYREDAKKILKDLWEKETAVANGKRYLIAGNWAQNQQELILNPSYFAPYAWRIFAQEDITHDWQSLIDPAYTLLEDVGKQPLDTNKGLGLPPDWVTVERKTGRLKAPSQKNLTTNYSYDAIRVPLRIGIDYAWNNDERARNYLQSFHYLSDVYRQSSKLDASYAHNGIVVQKGENPSMYATIIGAFMVTDPHLAKKIYEEKIVRVYSNATNSFDKNLPYYEQNMLWFGAALYNKQLLKIGK